MGIKSLVIAASLAGIAMPAAATDMFVEAGIHLGGDTVQEVVFTNGDSEKIKAGQLFSLTVGMHTDLGESLQGRASIGYKFDMINADNGDLTFTRIPLEFLVMKRYTYWMLGGGIAYHLSPEYEQNVPISVGWSGTEEFDDALGFVFAFDYSSKGKFDGEWYVGGRVTLIDYENDFRTLSGNSIGAVIGFMFE